MAAANLPILRASLDLPSCTLSLVRTFPRIINGYRLQRKAIVVVSMDEVASTRVNGEETGGPSIIVFKGNIDCRVCEPEGRLVAVVSMDADVIDACGHDFEHGYRILRYSQAALAPFQATIRCLLRAASASSADDWRAAVDGMQDTLFGALHEAMYAGNAAFGARGGTLARYKRIVDHIDHTVATSPMADLRCVTLTRELGTSARTLHTAVQSVCGIGIHRYSQLRRLWSVRRRLRTGAPGLSIKAAANSHGFWHLGEFAGTYRSAFGELPSETLARARR